MAVSTQIYYWPREFVLRSYAFLQPRSYRRAAISIIVSARGEFSIESDAGGDLSCGGVVLGPLTTRQNLRIEGAGWSEAVWLFDVAPGSAAHRGLLDWLKRKPMQVLPSALLEELRQSLQAFDQLESLSLEQAQTLHHQLCAGILGDQLPAQCDERVLQALAKLDGAALDEVSIGAIAKAIGLSESRLRSLVRRELACNLAQYARWNAAWKTILHWRPGMTLTDAAHAAGFHDLAHANHAANEMFGLSPSRALNNERVALFAYYAAEQVSV